MKFKESPITFCSYSLCRFKSALAFSVLVSSASMFFGAGAFALPVTVTRIVNADLEPQNWLTHGRTYSEQRFSPLDQINAENIESLGLAWSFKTGTTRGLEATPLVVDGIMYFSGSWSKAYAIDAQTGQELWKFDPKVPGATARKACCDVVNRGLAIWQDRLFLGTLDGRLIALDRRDGSLVWETMTVDTTKNYTITGAPRIVKGKVIIGNAGADLGVRGYFTAYEADTGKELWRFYTVPANRNESIEHPELALALKTWSEDSLWETGLGGTVWDSMAYDPELNLLYVGVGNGSPWNREVRSPGGGDNLFLSSILAVNPDTGRLVWYYQTTPAENWDYTATQHIILADLVIEKQRRKVLMQAPKNGFFYVIDRVNGELLSASNYVPVTWASHVDLKTGRPVETGADWIDSPATVRPGPYGGHNWQPMSYNPINKLVYIPITLNEWTYVPEKAFQMKSATWNTGEDIFGAVKILEKNPPKKIEAPTRLLAWDPVRNLAAWEVKLPFFKAAGTLSTAGGLIFQGNGGQFSAYSSSTGGKLWNSNVGVGIIAPPITYSIGDEQYVTVMAGLGGNSFASQPVPIVNEGRVLSYKIGGRAKMPAFAKKSYIQPDLPPLESTKEQVEKGKKKYLIYCLACHGINAVGGGMIPDLRYSDRQTHENWMAIVLGGLLSGKGMADFSDVLEFEEAANIQTYVLNEARKIGSSTSPSSTKVE
ncbi:MAG: PQQ-dependent dehydrogenase, methanol/ethanol family [Halieaceae bacterium]|nr:PQQ-dependent dehydrogenase, methanol/ethanol family [Halieaceae bacterium]